jgi:phosphoribosylformimino-5-aminoimidazole carboxamide ribotide isomerase
LFRIYPAVDIKDGRCVRLFQGDLQEETIYYEKPWEAAMSWEIKGASYLHVVDLDGAAANKLVNLPAVGEILSRVHIPVQCGGGVRSRDDIERLLSLGASRVVLGTRALEEPEFAAEVLADYGERVIVSVDTRHGEVAVGGWLKTVSRSLEDVLEHIAACGAERIIHTDIARDGTLVGYDTSTVAPLLYRGMGVIAAGGISSLADLAGLKALVEGGLEGAVIGKAIYDGTLDLAAALEMEEA